MFLTEAAKNAVRYDPKLRLFYERVRSRRLDQKAIIATANKMLKIIWLMLTRKEVYESANRKRYIKKLNRMDGKDSRCWQKVGSRSPAYRASIMSVRTKYGQSDAYEVPA